MDRDGFCAVRLIISGPYNKEKNGTAQRPSLPSVPSPKSLWDLGDGTLKVHLKLNSEVEKSSSFSCSSSSSRILISHRQTNGQNNCQEDRLFSRRRSPINRGRSRR